MRFPDCDVDMEVYDNTYDMVGCRQIVFKIKLHPNVRRMPTKEQIDRLASDLIFTACWSMEIQR